MVQVERLLHTLTVSNIYPDVDVVMRMHSSLFNYSTLLIGLRGRPYLTSGDPISPSKAKRSCVAEIHSLPYRL